MSSCDLLCLWGVNPQDDASLDESRLSHVCLFPMGGDICSVQGPGPTPVTWHAFNCPCLDPCMPGPLVQLRPPPPPTNLATPRSPLHPPIMAVNWARLAPTDGQLRDGWSSPLVNPKTAGSVWHAETNLALSAFQMQPAAHSVR